LAVALAGRLLFFLGGLFFRQPVHHWRLPNSNSRAVSNIFIYQQLAQSFNA